MPLEALSPERTAVLTMEMQRGVVGDLSPLPELAGEVARLGTASRIGELLRRARKAGAPVVHCVVERRPGGTGPPANAPLLRAMARKGGGLAAGSDAAELIPELGREASDLVSSRTHGVSPFGGTRLDAALRDLGVETIVATGVSLSLGIVGLAIEGVNLGYEVVVATDAVAGIPPDYAKAVMDNTIPLVARRATAEEIAVALEDWSHP